jgi:hypothetical protein
MICILTNPLGFEKSLEGKKLNPAFLAGFNFSQTYFIAS